MNYRKVRKLITNPVGFFNDAIKNRARPIPQKSTAAPLKKIQTEVKASMPAKTSVLPHEHLLAISILIPQRLENAGIKSKVYIVTSVPFWRARLGNQCRILELAKFIRSRFDLTVIYCDTITMYDAKEILNKGWAPYMHFLFNANNMFQLEFCHDGDDFINRKLYFAREFMAKYVEENPCQAIIVEYITHEPIIRGIKTSALKIIDTHDIMSSRVDVYKKHNRDHHIKITLEEEMSILDSFDYVMAIQSEEKKMLENYISKDKVLLSHHAVEICEFHRNRYPKRLVYIAGKNPANVDSMEWFLTYVWPHLKSSSLELHIYGQICELIRKSVEKLGDSKIIMHGEVIQQSTAYHAADIVINPVLYGGGLKIKTVEAMANGLPMVTTDEGARGLAHLADKAFLVANEPKPFAKYILDLCYDEALRLRIADEALKNAAEMFSAEACFSELADKIVKYEPKPSLENFIDECADSFERTLVFGKRDFPLFAGAESAFKKFKNVAYRVPSEIKSTEALNKIIKETCVDRVLINNPYINDHVLTLYKFCRAKGIPVTTFDRGALPDSWFFDRKGFNGDSESYSPELWDFELDADRRKKAEDYLAEYIRSNSPLEKQGKRIGGEALRKRFGLMGKKCLFVAFQRPNDSVVKFLSKHVDGMGGFIQLVNNIAKEVDQKQWAIVGKSHPLEIEEPDCLVRMASPMDHIDDLLEMADAVLVINSGVGLLALLHGKPTYVCGEAFYSGNGLAVEISKSSDMLEYLVQPETPDREKILRFLAYLIQDFYSFGKASGYLRKEIGGELSPITTKIDFYQIRGVEES